MPRVDSFLNDLGSESPSPGGGSAAALTAALGTALAEMVARLDARRLGRSESSVKRIAQLKRCRLALQSLVLRDARTFRRCSKAFKSDKHSVRYQTALWQCAQSPFEICEYCVRALSLAEAEIPRVGRWLSSDLAEAGVLLESAFAAARLNVGTNLRGLTDTKTRRRWNKRLDALQRKTLSASKKLKRVFR